MYAWIYQAENNCYGQTPHATTMLYIVSVPKKNKNIQAKIDEALFIGAGSGYEKVVSILVKQGAGKL